ncbi:MAG: alpha/beta hydrolase family protein [Dehalococcoidia bacterium]
MENRAGRLLVRWLYRLYWVTGIAVAIVVVVFALFPQVLTGFHTSLFVLQVLDVPIKPQSWFTADPVRVEVTYPRADGEGVADVYRIPDNRKRAAVLIFLGANAAGRDDPDVINLGQALARTGFAVMFHWSPTMGERNNIDIAEVENLVWAFQYLKDQEFVDQERVGMAGFSVGGSFAMVAAADGRIRDDVVFLNSFGAYYDARDFFLQIASRSQFFEGQITPWVVDRLTLRVFANELIEVVQDPAERDLLTRRFLDYEEGLETPLAQLSPEAGVSRQLLEGTGLAEAERLYENLPEGFLRDMEGISPKAHLEGLEARLLILHDQGDPLIPVGESRRLAEALQSRGNFKYTETQVFDHVRPGSGGSLWGLAKEGFKLFRHMYTIIRLAY